MLKRFIFSLIFLTIIVSAVIADNTAYLPSYIPRDSRNLPFSVPIYQDDNGTWYQQKMEFVGSQTINLFVSEVMIRELAFGTISLPVTRETITLASNIDTTGYKQIVIIYKNIGTGYANFYQILENQIDSSFIIQSKSYFGLSSSYTTTNTVDITGCTYNLRAYNNYTTTVAQLQYVIYGKK